MIALLRVYEVTGAVRYWKAFEKVRTWTFRHMVWDHSGTWVAFTDRWGFRRAPIRAGGHWLTGFHVTRVLLQCNAALDRLIARGENIEFPVDDRKIVDRKVLSNKADHTG